MKPVRIGDFLHRVKDIVVIEDNIKYKRVTIKTKNQGVSLRDEALGSIIGTKSQFRVKANQFILSKIDARWGAFGIVPNEVDSGIITGNFWTYEVDYEQVNINWFNLFTSSEFFIKICRNASSGVTNRQYLDEKFFLKYKVLLPSIPEQDRIVARLQALQALHREANDTLARLKADVKRLRQSILQDAIQGKLTDNQPAPGEKTGAELLADIRAEKERRARAAGKKPEAPLPPVAPEEMPFEVPEGWVWCRLGEVAYIASGSTPSQNEFVSSGGVPYLKVYNIVKQKINFDYRSQFITLETHAKQLKRSIVVPGDVLMNIVGPPLGKIAIASNQYPEWNINQAIVLIRPSIPTMHKWIYWFLNEMSAINSIDTKGVAGQSNISLTQSKNLLFPLPSISIQNQIVASLETRLHQLDQLDQQLAALQAKTDRLWKSELQQTFKFETEKTA